MRRVIRPHFLPALSLLTCVAACGLWVRSFGYQDVLKYAGGDGRVDFSLSSDRGILLFDRWSHSNHSAPLRWNWNVLPSDDGWRFEYPTGFRLGEESVEQGFNGFGFAYSPTTESGAVPHWFAVLLSAAGPALFAARRVRSHRRASHGRCPA